MRFVFVAAVASLGGLLFGFDTGVISGALLFIRADFGLSPTIQGIVASVVLVGAVGGAAAGGPLTDRFGRKPVIIAMAGLFAVGALLSAAASAVWMLLAGRLILGVAIGTASMLTPLYLSEVAPAERRGATVSLNQFCITFGILLSYLVDYVFADVTGTWRWMLGIGCVPGILLGLGMAALPESPRWLASRGRLEEAERVLQRLRGRADVSDELSGLGRDLRRASSEASLGALFAAPEARGPLVVGVGLAVFQQITGINTVIYYAPSIFRTAGFASNEAAILATVGIGVVNVLMTVVALLLVDRIGRRKLLLAGLVIMAVCLVAIAVAFSIGTATVGGVTAVALAAYVGGFAIGLGPVFWLLIAEIFPLAYRGRGMSVASMANWGSNLVVALVFLDLMRLATPGGTFALFALLTLAALGFAWKVVPETSGRSLEQIESDLGSGFEIRDDRPAPDVTLEWRGDLTSLGSSATTCFRGTTHRPATETCDGNKTQVAHYRAGRREGLMMDGTAELIRLTELLRIGLKTTRQIARMRLKDRSELLDLADRAEAMADELDLITGADTAEASHPTSA